MLADPDQDVMPSAVCGYGSCEPYDDSRMPQPQACAEWFPWLRAQALEATCIGASHRNLAEHRDTSGPRAVGGSC